MSSARFPSPRGSRVSRLGAALGFCCVFAGCDDSPAPQTDAPPVAVSPASQTDAPPAVEEFHEDYDVDYTPEIFRFAGGRNPARVFIKPLTDADRAKIDAMQKPFTLDFAFSDVADADLERFVRNPNLKQISLTYCPNATDAAVEIISRAPNLKHVLFAELPHWKSPNFAALAQCNQLESLTLGNFETTSEESLNGVAKCAGLKNLRLISCRVTDANLARLANLSELQYLHLQKCSPVADAGIAEIAKLSQLRYLSFDEIAQLSDAGVAPLGKLPQLETFRLTKCPRVTKEGLEALSALPVRSLRPPEQIFCDEAIGVLTKFPQLRSLDVWSPLNERLTADGVAKLKEIDGLQNISVVRCSPSERDAFEALRRELPNCQVNVGLVVDETKIKRDASPQPSPTSDAAASSAL
ncbi:MAG: hypothetical protein IKK39_16460 [Thermoguttaceae bacterium]|nr:hypothetical protein [Thermoguttaceae bacterium]